MAQYYHFKYHFCGQSHNVLIIHKINSDWQWTAKKTNEWVLNKAGVKRELLDTVKARKPAYYGHTMRKQGSCLEKEIKQGTMPGARKQERPRTAYMDNQDVDRTLRGRVNQNDRGQGKMEKVCPWCGQPSDRGRLKNRTTGSATTLELVNNLDKFTFRV